MRKILILFCALMAGCSVYKIDIQQGNMLDDDKVAQLREGMTKQQVSFLLGSAMLKDPFHQQRWDYFYSFKKAGKQTQRSQLVLYFEDERLSRIDKSRYAPVEK